MKVAEPHEAKGIAGWFVSHLATADRPREPTRGCLRCREGGSISPMGRTWGSGAWAGRLPTPSPKRRAR